MSEPAGSSAGARPEAHRSRTLLVTFLGSVVRRMGDWMPIGGAVDLLGQAGLDPTSVRTAVFRLKKRGWLVSETRSGVRGYALTPAALAAFAEGDEIIWHARRPADLADGWCIVTFSVPESQRAKRHQLRRHLTSLGFGNIGSAVWIAPARMQAAVEKLVTDDGLTHHCAVFVGDHVSGTSIEDLLQDAWDLAEIDARYRDFLAAYAAGSSGSGPLEGQGAFLAYLDVVDRWRKLPFRDPGLPTEVLPPGWSGPPATRLFESLVESLEPLALEHAARHWSG